MKDEDDGRPFTEAELMAWAADMRQETHECCGWREDEPHASTCQQWDELGTFGEALEYWAQAGGPTEDERGAFWMSWTRHTIAWVFVGVAALIVKVSFGGLVDTFATAIGAVAIVALGWQAMDAVRFGREGRRWR